MLLYVTFDKRYITRYIVEMRLGAERKPIKAIIDTACSTTLAPLKIAKKHGTKLNHSGEVVVGGHVYDAMLYLFENTTIGDFTISRFVAFAADYKGSIADRVLLGNNVLHNFVMELHRNKNGRLKFEYKPWSLVQGREHPCAMFFRSHDASPVYPNELLVEDGEVKGASYG